MSTIRSESAAVDREGSRSAPTSGTGSPSVARDTGCQGDGAGALTAPAPQRRALLIHTGSEPSPRTRRLFQIRMGGTGFNRDLAARLLEEAARASSSPTREDAAGASAVGTRPVLDPWTPVMDRLEVRRSADFNGELTLFAQTVLKGRQQPRHEIVIHQSFLDRLLPKYLGAVAKTLYVILRHGHEVVWKCEEVGERVTIPEWATIIEVGSIHSNILVKAKARLKYARVDEIFGILDLRDAEGFNEENVRMLKGKVEGAGAVYEPRNPGAGAGAATAAVEEQREEARLEEIWLSEPGDYNKKLIPELLRALKTGEKFHIVIDERFYVGLEGRDKRLTDIRLGKLYDDDHIVEYRYTGIAGEVVTPEWASNIFVEGNIEVGTTLEISNNVERLTVAGTIQGELDAENAKQLSDQDIEMAKEQLGTNLGAQLILPGGDIFSV